MGRSVRPPARRITRLAREVPEPATRIADRKQAAFRPPALSRAIETPYWQMCYWQMCRRPSSPFTQVPGRQTMPLRAA